jgi:hypothetical protein
MEGGISTATPPVSKPAAADAKRKQRFGALHPTLPSRGGHVMSSSPRMSWDDVPCVFVQAPTCPACGSPEYKRSKTVGQLDTGGKVKKVFCLECDEPYKIVISLPETGVEEIEDSKIDAYYWNRHEE